MSGHRIEKINEEIKKELSYIIPKLKDPRVHEFVTVTDVHTSPDLKTAKVYFTSMKDDEDQVLEGLMRSSGYIRGMLSKTMNLRYTPELTFVYDTSVRYGMHIDSMLADLDLDGSDSNEQQR